MLILSNFVRVFCQFPAGFLSFCHAYDQTCQMGQQPDPNNDNKMRWVLPMTKEERCACTKIFLGGVNIDPPPGAEEHFYRDDPAPL